jgi:transposase
VSRRRSDGWSSIARRVAGARSELAVTGLPCSSRTDFLEAVRAEQPDITLAALSRRLVAERSVKADTSMLSRFFRREGITFKKRHWSRASGTGRT